MVRGVVQLLLYRIVYQFAPLDVSNLSSALDVAGCMLGMYLLYLRVSGTFHLIVGLLHMFGFNLPETHHLYLLASSFTDFWRRINIYWKDFVMKLFFYPTHFALRRIGPLRAMSVATLATFLATWLLHSWQWFWIRGTPLFNWKDFSFWAIFAVLVLVTAIYETTRGRKRTLTPSRVTLRQRFILGLEAGVGRVSDVNRCRRQTNLARHRHCPRRLGHSVRMRHVVGTIKPRNLGGPKHKRNSRAISLLALGGCSYGWLDMSPGWAVSRYLDNPRDQRPNSAAS
jgi:hypothetical protein